MTNGTRLIHGQVCARASELAQIERIPTTSHAVSGALLEAKIDVDLLTLDEWKAILFGAFQAANDASSPRTALSENAPLSSKTAFSKKTARNRLWHRTTTQ
jgi:hypothetical protein